MRFSFDRLQHLARAPSTAISAAMAATLIATASEAAEPGAANTAAWAKRLLTDVTRVDAASSAKVGVYVRDLGSGEVMNFQGLQRWYIASMVKVPVAITVLRGVERGQYTLDTRVTLRAGDYVDGAGTTNRQPVGAQVAVRALMEQMIIHSDNTATDVLMDLVGVTAVNDTVDALVPDGFQRITTLSEVRRNLYTRLTPEAAHLTGQELILLNRQKVDGERLKLLAHMTGTPVEKFRLPTLQAAYNGYYATGLNSARLDAYADLLAQLEGGQALGAAQTTYLLKLMERVTTGPQRIKAGLPHFVRYAHKTGTQRQRICDAGLVRVYEDGRERRVAVVACAAGEPSLAKSEQALMQVGAALCRSGLLTQGTTDEPFCPAPPALASAADTGRLPARLGAAVPGAHDTGGDVE